MIETGTEAAPKPYKTSTRREGVEARRARVLRLASRPDVDWDLNRRGIATHIALWFGIDVRTAQQDVKAILASGQWKGKEQPLPRLRHSTVVVLIPHMTAPGRILTQGGPGR